MGIPSLSSSLSVSIQSTGENRTEICAQAKAVFDRLPKKEVECIGQLIGLALREQSIVFQQKHLEENKALLERLRLMEVQTSQTKAKEKKEMEDLKSQRETLLQEDPILADTQKAKKERTEQIQQVQNENHIQLEQIQFSQEEALEKSKENLQMSVLRVEQVKQTAQQFNHQVRKIADDIEIEIDQEKEEVVVLQEACEQKKENIKKLDKEIQAPHASILTGVMNFWKSMTTLTREEKLTYLAKIIFDLTEIILIAEAKEQPTLYKRTICYINCHGYPLLSKIEPMHILIPYLAPGVLENIEGLKHRHMLEASRLIQQTMQLTSWREFDQMDRQQRVAKIQLLVDAIINNPSLPSLKEMEKKMEWTSQDHMYGHFHSVIYLFSIHAIRLISLTGIDSSYLIGRVQLLKEFDCSDEMKQFYLPEA